jgi:hypothetical protein
MAYDLTTFRPRNGACAESYWRIRYWCEDNGFTMSDVLNAVLIPLAYHLEHFCKVDRSRNMATVDLTVGEVIILHVFGGKCYPLRSTLQSDKKHNLTLDDIKAKIQEWKQRNAENPAEYDRILLLDGKQPPKATGKV